MKKIGYLLILSLLFLLVSCVEAEEKPFDPDLNLDTENTFFDDFTNGIDPNYWEIGNSKWGVNNGGVVHQNVNYTEDGVVILQANGDLYKGDIQGIGNDHGRRTGAMITTREALGPGRYEVSMKVMPRFGATTAMWTYYFENGMNHEIDIELNVQNDFNVMMTTNWISLTDYTSKSNVLDNVLNDFEWKVFRFDWHTNPNRIDYYLDDVLISTQTAYVPTFAGEFNIGNWFPDAWAGVPDFETDYTYIDWFKYTPYLDNPYIPTASGPMSPINFYPSAPVEYPVANLISNASFEADSPAWRYDVLSDVEIQSEEGMSGSNAIFIPKNQIAYQFVTGLDETFEMTLIANAKLPNLGSGYILLEFYPLETVKIDQYIMNFSYQDQDFKANEYYEKEFTFTVPDNTKRVEISLIGGDSDIYFDELFFNLSKKPKPVFENLPSSRKFHEDFSEGIDPNKWSIANQKWGGTNHGGVIYQNVNLTKNGELLITANGDNYEGPLVGIDRDNGKRTGGAIFTNQSFGPGSFEVRAKIMPRFGATSAFWTYNYLNGINSEIDFEFNVNNDFSTVWLTNWLTEQDYINNTHKSDFVHNDNEFHVYRFEWHTLPTPYIEYYIDDVLVHTENTKVPTMSARFWIGVWFPNNWAGNPDFETDYMIVDYFTYESFPGEPYTLGPNGGGSPIAFYPNTTVDLPVANLISQGNFDHATGYTLIGDANISNGSLNILQSGAASQVITGMDDRFEMYFETMVKGLGSGKIQIEFLDTNNLVIGSTQINIDTLNESNATKISENVTFVKDTKSVRIVLEGSQIIYDDVFFNLASKVE